MIKSNILLSRVDTENYCLKNLEVVRKRNNNSKAIANKSITYNNYGQFRSAILI